MRPSDVSVSSSQTTVSRWAAGLWQRLAEGDSGLGLGLFRVHFSLVALAEAVQLFLCRHLIFNEHPATDPSPVAGTILLVAWSLALIMLVLGVKIRLASWLNWGLAMWYSLLIKPLFLYHNDFAMWGASTFFLLLPSRSPVSLATLLQRKSGTLLNAVPASPVALRVFLSFFFLALYYLDSITYKTTDDMWLEGLGFWLPATLPHARWLNLSFLLDQQMLVKAASLIVIVFEGLFMFLLPFRKCRWVLIALGAALHLGILIAYPIPQFALGILAFYWILIPDSLLRRWFWKKQELDVGASTGAIFPRWRQYVVLSLVVGTVLQSLFTVSGSTIVRSFLQTRLPESWLLTVDKIAKSIDPFTVRLLGMTYHGVYVYDRHFRNNYNIIELTELNSGKRLPLFRENGQAHPWCHDRMWVYVMFRAKVNSASTLEREYGRLAEYFCKINRWKPSKTQFQLKWTQFPTEAKWVPQSALPRVTPEVWSSLSDLRWSGKRFKLVVDKAEVNAKLQLRPGQNTGAAGQN